MRFLCVACDEAMNLTGTEGPDEGSMTVLFACPSCGQEVAMLTNAMETQMVRALGVQIGGRAAPAAPMETVRSSLSPARADAPEPDAPEPDAQEPTEAPSSSGSRCPFTGMVNEAFEEKQSGAPRWTPAAEARLERIPPMVRSMVRKSIDQHAREQGHAEITEDILDAVKGKMGM